MVRLSQLNKMDRAEFVAVCGPLFEGSPWIAERTSLHRSRRNIPISSSANLKAAFVLLCSGSTATDSHSPTPASAITLHK